MSRSLADENLSLRAQLEHLKAKARPEGPDTTPKGAIDGRSDRERLLDPTTNITEVIEIRARQRSEEGGW